MSEQFKRLDAERDKVKRLVATIAKAKNQWKEDSDKYTCQEDVYYLGGYTALKELLTELGEGE